MSKICGITNKGIHNATKQVSALGFVFYKDSLDI